MSTLSRLEVELTHRMPLPVDGLTPLMNLQDIIEPGLWRSMAALRMIASCALDDATPQQARDTVYWAIDAVIKELQDIESLINAFVGDIETSVSRSVKNDSEHCNQQAQKNPEL